MNIQMKNKNDISISLAGAVLITAFIFTSVEAAPLTVTNTFADGNVLTAGELNTNFGDVETAVNDNNINVGNNATSIADNITAIGNNATSIVNNATAISTKQDRVTGTCPAGQAISVINADGTVACEITPISGVEGILLTGSVTITSTTAVSIGTITISETGTFDVALNAHASVEITGNTISRLKIEIHNSTCTGTILGEAMWRPGGSATDNTLIANTISLTGFQANVSGPETYELCARKFDTSFPDALIFFRGFNLSYSN